MSTVDIEKILQSDDIDALGKVLDNHGQRRRWNGVLRGIEGGRAPGDIFLRGVAESALAAMDQQQGPATSTIQVLRAEERLVQLNRDARWVPFMEAREEGASWEEIAAAVNDDTGEHVRAWYAERITKLDPPLSDAEMTRARAVLDDAPAAQPERADGARVDAVVDDPPADGES